MILQSALSVVPSLEYDDRTKNSLFVKIAELLGISTKITLMLFQLWLQHILFSIYTSRCKLRGCQCNQSCLLIHLRGWQSHKQHRLRGPIIKSVHPKPIIIHNSSSEKDYTKNLKENKKCNPVQLYSTKPVKYKNLAIYIASVWNVFQSIVCQIIIYPSNFYNSKLITLATTGEK